MARFDLFWAKWRGKRKGDFHPLLFHTLDVGVVARELWQSGLHEALRRFFVSELGLSRREAIAWISFFAALHDIGKASPAFQRQSEPARTTLQEHGFQFRSFSEDCPHGIITTHVLPDILRALSEAEDEAGGFPPEFGRALGLTVGGHHGTFYTRKPRPGQRGEREWTDARLSLAAELAKFLRVPVANAPRYSTNAAFYVLLAGLTCVADWIGSNEQHFRYAPKGTDPEHYAKCARQRAREGVKALGWTGWKPPASVATFAELFPFIQSPWACQRQAETLARRLPRAASLVLIEAPMGEGKTEAAMFLADYWAATLKQQGCYFALPTQATSNQMFKRVKQFIGGRYPDQMVNLQLVHGGSLLSEEFMERRFRTYPEEGGSFDEQRGKIAVEEWFLPKKRSLLASFGVGTIDQALLAVLQTRHFFVRLFGLAHKTIVVDEVHAYDTYMSTLLERMLEWLRAVGCSVVLLSATLPAQKRRRLLQAFGGQAPTCGTGYPQITWIAGDESGAVSFPAVQRRELSVHHLDGSVTDFAERLREMLKNGGCVAVICNTVGRAQEAYQALRQQRVVEPDDLQILHSRFPYSEREQRESLALTSFGKGGIRPRTAVLVATQIIEQSLDLDFDLIVTDLAPVDLVLQRAGRLHRHENVRPNPLNKPTLWLRMPDRGDDQVPDFGAYQRIYDRYILLRSYIALKARKSIHLPEDLPIIVEEVYGDEVSWPSLKLKQAADVAWNDMQQTVQQEKSTAKGNLIPPPDAPGEPREVLECISRDLEEDNPDLHRSLQALTRLTEPSVQVVCLVETKTGIALEADGEEVDMSIRPTAVQTRSFLRQAMTITDKRMVFTLRDRTVPSGWKRTPALRHHRPLIFSEGKTAVGEYVLRLDPELGLIVDDECPVTNG